MLQIDLRVVCCWNINSVHVIFCDFVIDCCPPALKLIFFPLFFKRIVWIWVIRNQSSGWSLHDVCFSSFTFSFSLSCISCALFDLFRCETLIVFLLFLFFLFLLFRISFLNFRILFPLLFGWFPSCTGPITVEFTLKRGHFFGRCSRDIDFLVPCLI